MQRTLFSTLAALLLLGSIAPSSADDLSVPPQMIEGGSPEQMMHRYLLQQVEPAIKQWTWDYERRKTPEAIAAYQKSLREKLLDAIGGLPERTPLNQQTAGIISRDGYRVEKVIFESQPKHYVTALCFLPDSSEHKPPYPGVIVPCGHSDLGKAFPTYQTMGVLLALNGMAALVFDPIDQGERGQYLGGGGWPALKCTAAHTMLGTGCIALGRNTASFKIWDGMRAIDYLQSRSEVDPKRIGCTGCSGGGTQTSYLMALDDRIVAAAPSCYITSLSRLLTTAGPQDAEQNIFGQLAIGLDHADWLTLRAPSPVLVCSATHDFFDIGGTWESFRRAKRLYTRLGCAERIDLLESDASHGYDRPHREGAARWMSRWLLGKDIAIKEPAAIKLLTQKECLCVPNGKVMTLPGARSAYDLNEDYENELAKRRESLWRAEDKTTAFQQVRKLAGIRTLSELPKPKVETIGNVARQGCKVESLLIKPESGISLPAIWFLPEKPSSNRVVLYLHHQGKTADADLGSPIDRLVQAGSAVLAVDLRGIGQTQSPRQKGGYSSEYQDAMLAYLLGRSYVGMRAEDVLVCARYAAERFANGRPIAAHIADESLYGERISKSGRNGRIYGRNGDTSYVGNNTVDLVAVGNVGIPALHAAALEPDLFGHIAISHMQASWSSIIHNRLSKDMATHLVHGSLLFYDLPNLITALGGKLSISHLDNR